MNTTQIIITILISFFAGISMFKIIPMFKDKKITDEEKKDLNELIIKNIKRALRFSQTNSTEEIKKLTINFLMEDLREYGMENKFTKDDIEIMVDLALSTINKLINKEEN